MPVNRVKTDKSSCSERKLNLMWGSHIHEPPGDPDKKADSA